MHARFKKLNKSNPCPGMLYQAATSIEFQTKVKSLKREMTCVPDASLSRLYRPRRHWNNIFKSCRKAMLDSVSSENILQGCPEAK